MDAPKSSSEDASALSASSSADNAPTGSGVTTPGKAKIRLLPMELRRRRRAAKLLMTQRKEVNENIVPASDLHQNATPEEVNAAVNEQQALEAIDQRSEDSKQPDHHDAPNVFQESTSSPEETQLPDELPPQQSPSSTSATATITTTSASITASARLHSIYALSGADRKRQRLQQRPQVEVPNIFHLKIIPVDLAPKSKVVLLTSFPFPFIRTNARAKAAAIQSFTASTSVTLSDATELETEMRWHQALQYFTHPGTPLPASITLNRITATTKSNLISAKSELMKEEHEFYMTRLHTWQESFRDAYTTFRRLRGTRCFYLHSDEFTVCFYKRDGNLQRDNEMNYKEDDHLLDIIKPHQNDTEIFLENDSLEDNNPIKKDRSRPRTAPLLRSVMSQSTARVRKALHHLNVSYSIPYSTNNTQQRQIGEFHLIEEELVALEAQSQQAISSRQAVQQNVHGHDSLLLFQGHHEVHGLYEFLINRKPLSKQDVPEIFALHPFANATIKSLDVKYMGKVGAPQTSIDVAAEGSAEGNANVYFRTEISGFCQPTCLQELLHVLKDECQSHSQQQRRTSSYMEHNDNQQSPSKNPDFALRAYIEPVHGAERLNALVVDEKFTKACGPLSLTLEMREQRKQELELTKRRIQNVVIPKADQADLIIETTTRITN